MSKQRAKGTHLCACGCGREVVNEWAKGHHRRRPLRDRILDKIEVREDGCWQWLGAVNTNGYGAIGSGVGKKVSQAHRASYEAFVGPIPPGLHIDHICRNRLCVRPAHLEAVTQAENNQRMWDANRPTTCSRGHAIEGGNALLLGINSRPKCRTCHNARNRAARRGISTDEYLELAS